MGSNDPKRQHYIPKMLLRNFCNDNDKLWVGDKSQDKIYSTTPDNVFVESNFYTRYAFDRVPENCEYQEFSNAIEKGYEYEEALSALEGKADSVVRIIIELARKMKCPELSPEQETAFKQFVMALARRTPESQKRVSLGGDRDIFYEASKARADELNYNLPDREILYQDLRIRKLKECIESNVNARFAAGDRPNIQSEVARFCREVGLRVARICMPKRSFIIGSHGLTIIPLDHKSSPMRGSLIPIAHDVVVQMTPFPDKKNLLCLDQGSDSLVRTINKTTAAQSKIIAGRSEALIRSLMRG